MLWTLIFYFAAAHPIKNNMIKAMIGEQYYDLQVDTTSSEIVIPPPFCEKEGLTLRIGNFSAVVPLSCGATAKLGLNRNSPLEFQNMTLCYDGAESGELDFNTFQEETEDEDHNIEDGQVNYTVEISDIQVGNQHLIVKEMFLIDSTSKYSYVSKEIFKFFQSYFNTTLDMVGNLICFPELKYNNAYSDHIQNISLGNLIDWEPINYIMRVDDYPCLGLQVSEDKGLVLGQNFLRQTSVFIDLKKSQLTFKPNSCLRQQVRTSKIQELFRNLVAFVKNYWFWMIMASLGVKGIFFIIAWCMCRKTQKGTTAVYHDLQKTDVQDGSQIESSLSEQDHSGIELIPFPKKS